MKKLVLYILLLFSNLSNAQQKQFSTGVAIYEEVDVYGQKNIVQLFFSNEKSFYVKNRGAKERINRLANGEILDMNNDEKAAKQLSQNNMFFYPYFIDEEGDIVYMNWKNDSMIFREVLKHDPIIIEEPRLPKQNWQIMAQTKKIGRFTCTKAICTFRGRNYEAWFTLEIPVPSGPWKLNGLPGLILDAQDSQGEYKYTFKSIDIPLKDDTELLKLPNMGERGTISQYESILKKKEAEHIRKLLSKAAARGTSLSILPDDKIKQELSFEQ